MDNFRMIFQPRDYQKLAKREILCACCGSGSCIEAFSGDRYNFGLRTTVCRKCGLIFTNPRPDKEWFEDFYRHHYRQFYENVSIPDEAYLSRDFIRGRHSRNVEFLSRFLPDSGSLIDIGCAEGTFLHLFLQRFPRWKVWGIEPSEDFSAFAKSYYQIDSIINGSIEDLHNYNLNRFDIITASHVLEHLLDPNIIFIEARNLLKKNGLLFIDVPDIESNSRGIGNLHIAHVYHFSERTLSNFLHKHGFRLVMSCKGREAQVPWTFQIIGQKLPHPPKHWQPPPIHGKQVARAFRMYCKLPLKARIKQLLSTLKIYK